MRISKTIQYFAALFLALMAIGLVMHKTGYTFQVVDQIYCRGHLPWSVEYSVGPCVDRSGDDLFENDFIETELQYLSDNPHQQTYSERVMNGYPMKSAYSADTFTFFHLLSRFLPTTSSIIFSALLMLFVSFTLGYALARSLSFDWRYSIIAGFLSLTPSYVGLFEAWNHALIAYELLWLGIIRFYRYAERYLFALCAFLGASMIILSSIYQLYLYAILNAAFFIVFYLAVQAKQEKKKILVAFLVVAGVFLSAAMVWNASLSQHLSYLKDSNKVNLQLPFTELIRRKGYALDPLGWAGSEMVIAHRAVFHRILSAPVFRHVQAFQSGYVSPGIGYLLLLFVGLVCLWKKKGLYRAYAGLVLFWFLYFTGPLQFLLTMTVGGPFKSETSIRASYLFFLFGVFAVLYVLRGIARGSVNLSKHTKVVLWLSAAYVLCISLVLFIADFFKSAVFSTAPYSALAAVAFLAGLWYVQRQKMRLAQTCLIVSVLLPTAAQLFLGATPAVFSLHANKLYFPQTAFAQALDRYPDIERIALIQTPSGGSLHPNTAILLGRAGVNAYRNPTDRYYLEFAKYHELLANGIPNTADAFRQFRASVMYPHNGVVAMALTDNQFTLTEATSRYFDLLAVDGLITSHDLLIKDADWEKVASTNELALWRRIGDPPTFFFATNTLAIEKDAERLAYIFTSQTFDPGRDAVLERSGPPLVAIEDDAENKIFLREVRDGYRRFTADIGQAGVLTIPAVYHPRWVAKWIGTDRTRNLQTARSNYAFWGVIVPVGSGELELIYNEQPQAWQYGLMALGLFLGIAITLWIFSRNLKSVSTV